MSEYVWGDNQTQYFYKLGPDLVLDSIEALGISVTGRCLALNSLENRVYEIEVDDDEKTPLSERFIVAKFYRPGRWSKEQILDEHEFMFDLQENDISVVAPLKINNKSLFETPGQNILYAVFPKKGGRLVDEMSFEQVEVLGRTLARMHNIGSAKKAEHRITIDSMSFGEKNIEYLNANKLIPMHYEKSYLSAATLVLDKMKPLFKDVCNIRIHGDCHWGNIISRDEEGLFLIDFDDMLNGPAVQDIWLAIPGVDQDAVINRSILIESYESMRAFNPQELKLIEPLRTLRYIHFTAWIAQRYEDPSFKRAFPQFETDYYWQEQINDLSFQLTKF